MAKSLTSEVQEAIDEVLACWEDIPEDFDLPEEPQFLFDLFYSIAHLSNTIHGYPSDS